jgi:mannan endo-1,4-beta-mannosidase
MGRTQVSDLRLMIMDAGTAQYADHKELGRWSGAVDAVTALLARLHVVWGAAQQLDSAGTLADSMRQYTRLAASLDVLVIWCLWNGAGGNRAMDNRTRAMIEEPSGAALTSFIDNALVPLVKALAGEPGLGAWEIMNEPEGSLSFTKDLESTEPCFNPKRAALSNGWSKNEISMRNLQRFA